MARQELNDRMRPFKKELEANDKKLALLTAERSSLEERLTQPLPPAEIVEAGKRLKACGDQIDALEERWLELNDMIEGLTAQVGNDS
ncbi:hypothetical protein D3C86_1815490 [compost metagenome]